MCEIIDMKHCKTLCTCVYYHTLLKEKVTDALRSFTLLHFVESFSPPTKKDVIVEEGCFRAECVEVYLQGLEDCLILSDQVG